MRNVKYDMNFRLQDQVGIQVYEQISNRPWEQVQDHTYAPVRDHIWFMGRVILDEIEVSLNT